MTTHIPTPPAPPIERLRDELAAHAHKQTGAPAATGAPASPTTVRSGRAMTSIPNTAHNVAKDREIVGYQDENGGWHDVDYTVTREAHAVPGAMVEIGYRDAAGSSGVLVLPPTAPVHLKPTPREAMIADARQMLDWLEDHPDVPIGAWDSCFLQHHIAAHNDYDESDEAACRAVVHRAAEAIGAEVDEHTAANGRVHIGAEVRFGRAEYGVVLIIPAEQDGATQS